MLFASQLQCIIVLATDVHFYEAGDWCFCKTFQTEISQEYSRYLCTHTQIHKISAKNNQAGKDEQLGRASQFSFNSSSLGYVRMLQGLTIYIFRQGLPHWNSAEGLFCSVPWCVVSVIPGTVMYKNIKISKTHILITKDSSWGKWHLGSFYMEEGFIIREKFTYLSLSHR